ncbi:18933_t:CDS:2, partial [Entrophospora sp. SA101]
QKFQQFRNNSRNLQRNLNTCRDDLLLSDIQIDIKWAPEKGVVPKNWLSPYNKDLVNDSEIGEGKYILGEKLLQTLMPKKNYVVHYRALQLYISLGIK